MPKELEARKLAAAVLVWGHPGTWGRLVNSAPGTKAATNVRDMGQQLSKWWGGLRHRKWQSWQTQGRRQRKRFEKSPTFLFLIGPGICFTWCSRNCHHLKQIWCGSVAKRTACTCTHSCYTLASLFFSQNCWPGQGRWEVTRGPILAGVVVGGDYGFMGCSGNLSTSFPVPISFSTAKRY